VIAGIVTQPFSIFWTEFVFAKLGNSEFL